MKRNISLNKDLRATYLRGMKIRMSSNQQVAARFTGVFYKVPALSHRPMALVARRFWLTSRA